MKNYWYVLFVLLQARVVCAAMSYQAPPPLMVRGYDIVEISRLVAGKSGTEEYYTLKFRNNIAVKAHFSWLPGEENAQHLMGRLHGSQAKPRCVSLMRIGSGEEPTIAMRKGGGEHLYNLYHDPKHAPQVFMLPFKQTPCRAVAAVQARL